jgi:hypothetical protein
MKRWVLVASVALGCGGSSKHAGTSVDPERARIEAMKPASPYETRSVRGYTAPTTCGQGPYRIEAAALGARFGEEIEINICAPRSLQGDYQFTRGKVKDEPAHFGSRNNSEHCKPTDAELARSGTAGLGGGSTASTGTATGTGGSSSASRATTTGSATGVADNTAALALVAVTGSVGETCPQGTYLTGIVDFTTESTADGIPWDAGMSLALNVWSTEPLDLDGAVFVVIQRGVRANMTLDGWVAYRAAWDHWNDIWNAYLAGEVTAGRASYLDTTARSADAPPPPRTEVKPPKPSVHAEWIPGYWQRISTWVWSAGFWRVPDADIVAEQTVEAPVVPPPPKAEEPPPPPAPVAPPTPRAATVSASATVTAPTPATVPASPTLVWTPGYWAWNGTAYIWIEGAWRIPPQAGARWEAPRWAPRRGRVVFVPGGWSVSVRIGR